MADEEDENVLDRVLSFSLARIAHGQRNVLETAAEIQMQAETRERREVLLPGVDVATAWTVARGANTKAGTKICRAEPIPGRPEGARAYLERGWALYFHETWVDLHHLVRYFELIERNEAPDTPLLEWLIVARVVPAAVARHCVKKFRGEDVPLDEADCARLEMAAEVAEQLERDEAAKKA